MNRYMMRYIFGVMILSIHFAAIAVYLFRALQVLEGEDLLKQVGFGVLALGPLTLTYAMVFFRYVVANPRQLPEELEPIDWPPFMVQLAIILLFGAALIGGLFYLFYDESAVGGYTGIQTFVSVLETAFAGFIGLIFSSLFPLQWEQQKQANAAQPTPAVEGGAQPTG